jgi:hypothetical protein
VASVIGVLVVVALVIAIAVAAGSGKGGTGGTRQTFDAGPTKSLARTNAEGGPVHYPDALNRGRPIYVQHLGSDAAVGWRAFGAYDPDRPSCLVEWSTARKAFVNLCDRSTTYPPDGHGLKQYATRVVKDHLIVDLHRQ